MTLLRCIAFVVSGAVAAAQSRPATPRMPAFEMESIAPSAAGRGGAVIDMPAGDRFTAADATLRDLIVFAYGVEPARLLGGPDWIAVERYDVAASAAALPAWSGGDPPVPLLLMVRTLLADRFGLVVRRETRALPAYALAVARDDRKFGPEIAPSKLACGDSIAIGAVLWPGREDSRCRIRVSPAEIVVRGRRMSQFATVLSSVVRRAVIDRTRLPGTFDFRFVWTPDSDERSFVAALQEQLGLRLESTDAELDVLVIDRVERPAAD